MRRALIIFGLLVVCAMAFVRFAPVGVDRFHVSAGQQLPGDYPSAGGFMAVRAIATTPDRLLLVLDDVAKTTPRTKLVAGNVPDEMLTYMTRSRVFGFPDYTTVEIIPEAETGDPLLVINARLRYGYADLGVNEARVKRWLDELGLLTVLP